MPVKHKMKDVVILLPGILGSVLQREGKDIWAPTGGAAMRALWSLGRSVKSLELQSDPWGQDDLGDGVTATRLMPDVHLIPGLWTIDGYGGIREFIMSNFDVVPGVTYIEFPYDWRRDNRVAARKLRRVADEALAVVRKDNPTAKLILVGHSMGGLVARSFLEQFDGAKDTRALITFGTPHRGSLNAVDFIANGFSKKVGPLKLLDLSKLLRSLTSVYQLLPIYPCVWSDGKYLRLTEATGLVPHLDEERARAAIEDFHGDIVKRAAAHGPTAYEICSVVGITQGTKQSARVDNGKLVVEESYNGEDLGGDSTVPAVSATPVETDDWMPKHQPMYAADRHGSLQNTDPVQTQLLGVLTAPDRRAFRATASGLALELDEIFEIGEGVSGNVYAPIPRLELVATVVDLATGTRIGDPRPLPGDADGIHRLDLGELREGDYRVSVEIRGDASQQVAEPVHGLFSVAADEPVGVE
jgi:pimeloyl-ACP methyl ester carboxylesterase